MSEINNTPINTGAAYTGQTNESSQSGETSAIASGMLGQKGGVPSAAREQDSLTRNALQIQALFAAIKEIMPEGTEDTEVLLMQIADSLKETQSKLQAMGIEASTANKKADLKELSNKQAEIEAARKKAARKSGIAKLFSKIAGMISAAFTAAVGIAMFCIAPSPQTAAVALMGMVMVANESTKLATGKSMFNHMFNNQYFEMGMIMGMAVAAAVISCGSTAPALASSTAQVSMKAANIAVSITQATMTATGAGLNYTASMSNVGVQKMNANIKDFEAIMEALSEFLERAIKQYVGIEKSIEQLTEQAYEAVKNKQALTMSIKVTV